MKASLRAPEWTDLVLKYDGKMTLAELHMMQHRIHQPL
jgi:hypothetical protein